MSHQLPSKSSAESTPPLPAPAVPSTRGSSTRLAAPAPSSADSWSPADQQRLRAACQRVRQSLLNERHEAGHWTGELCSSALATATAVSALTLVERHDPTDASAGCYLDEQRETWISELIVGGIRWLAEHQNADGGWGDTDKSYSNIATTMLAVAAFHLTGVPVKHEDLLERAEAYIERAGGLKGLRDRYGRDKTFAVPILTNYALANRVSWKKVAPLPFELACFPQSWYRFLKLPVVSYAIPALVAIGQARYFHRKPWDPIRRYLRGAAVEKSLEVLQQIQPESGGYLEAIPLTSFVIMSLAATDRAQHPVVQRGTEFLLSSVRADGSWPIDTNLATWNTSLSIAALARGTNDRSTPGTPKPDRSNSDPSNSGASNGGRLSELDCLEWLLDCQYREVHPYTGADPGGWGWSDLSGAVPDADDTPAALLALAAWRDAGRLRPSELPRVLSAVGHGLRWLLDLQNRDGGWPTFCHGWGRLPFDRSGADLTAHALRACEAWQAEIARGQFEPQGVTESPWATARQKAWRFLVQRQRSDGSWVPLWFGNQEDPAEENPVYGTAKVLFAYRDCQSLDTPAAQRALRWLREAQNRDGGWGGGRLAANDGSSSGPDGSRPAGSGQAGEWQSSVEETALAVEALLAEYAARDKPGHEGGGASGPSTQLAIYQGLRWLMQAVEGQPPELECSPIGFYFAKLWYYERLYPLIFTVSALGRATEALLPSPTPTSH